MNNVDFQFPYENIREVIFEKIEPQVKEYIELCFSKLKEPKLNEFYVKQFGFNSIESYINKIIEIEKTNFIERCIQSCNNLIIDLKNAEDKNFNSVFFKSIFLNDDLSFMIKLNNLAFVLTEDEFIYYKVKVSDKIKQMLITKIFDIKSIEKINKNAVIFLVVDCSGSFGFIEREYTLYIFSIIKSIMQMIYKDITIQCISYSTEAQFIDYKDIRDLNASGGGTLMSSSYKLIFEHLKENNYNNEDIFIFHFSDGDNLSSDNKRTIDLINEISDSIKLYFYIEISSFHNNPSYFMINLQENANKKNINFMKFSNLNFLIRDLYGKIRNNNE